MLQPFTQTLISCACVHFDRHATVGATAQRLQFERLLVQDCDLDAKKGRSCSYYKGYKGSFCESAVGSRGRAVNFTRTR